MRKKTLALPIAAMLYLAASYVGIHSVFGQEETAPQPVGVIDENRIREIATEVVENNFSKGFLSIDGAEIEFGGKLELNLIDTASERSLLVGRTDNPDTHLEFDRLRLTPVIDVGRGISIAGQLDFLADEDSFIKEAVFEWDYDHDWWLESVVSIGLDDTFIHRGPGSRLSESYPLLGDAFWRDEEIAIIWALTLGNPKGNPVEMAKIQMDEHPPRETLTDSTKFDAFDFNNNPGALTFHFSLGDGLAVDSHSVNKDKAQLQRVIHDDRRVDDGLALRHFGAGVTYQRDFNRLGEVGVSGFYFNDEMNDDDINFLQQGLTLFDDLTNAPLAGYGLSGSNTKYRYGATVTYHLEGFHILDYWMDTKPGDGLYLTAQYMEARDGQLEREGYYVQASYRYSFQQPLFGERYVRYVEPFVRWGELESNVSKIASLPLTWDREEIVFGLVTEVTGKVMIKTEYALHDETTGGSDVNNDEFLFQLLITF